MITSNVGFDLELQEGRDSLKALAENAVADMRTLECYYVGLPDLWQPWLVLLNFPRPKADRVVSLSHIAWSAWAEQSTSGKEDSPDVIEVEELTAAGETRSRWLYDWDFARAKTVVVRLEQGGDTDADDTIDHVLSDILEVQPRSGPRWGRKGRYCREQQAVTYTAKNEQGVMTFNVIDCFNASRAEPTFYSSLKARWSAEQNTDVSEHAGLSDIDSAGSSDSDGTQESTEMTPAEDDDAGTITAESGGAESRLRRRTVPKHFFALRSATASDSEEHNALFSEGSSTDEGSPQEVESWHLSSPSLSPISLPVTGWREVSIAGSSSLTATDDMQIEDATPQSPPIG